MVTFFSNFLNDHQIPFCNEMYSLLGGDFRFVATTPIAAERLAMGYEDVADKYPYALNAWVDEGNEEEAMRLGSESDVVILGDAPLRYVEQRLKANKLTFRYTERYFKRGRWRILDPRVAYHHYINDYKWRHKRYYLLCASAYTAPDCRFIGCYPGKAFRWGYFPATILHDQEKLMAGKSHIPNILWVGRMIDWKRPMQAVELAANLHHEGYHFTMTMIGQGPMRKEIEDAAVKKGIAEIITFKNFMPHPEVRSFMEQSNIFIFTSTKQEGWGAVLNEAMSSGCAVVANDEIGSVPFLIRDGVNGLTYHHNLKALTIKVEWLLNHPKEAYELGVNAFGTMQTTWSAANASHRLLSLIDSLKTGHPAPFADGPCSAC